MKIGRYEIEEEVGRGGMGVVYRARHPNGSAVALKVIGDPRPGRTERFAREARLQDQLGESAGFVPLLDLGTSPQGPFLVMPLLSGGTLAERLASGPMPAAEAAALAEQLASALGRAHAAGVVHRDVKPDNVIFTGEGKPLVADLGLAKHFRRDLSGASMSVALSRGGEMRGTLGYMAPEQLRDASKAGPCADVFSLGAVLYECLAGHPPFEAPTYMELLARVAGGQRAPLPATCPLWLSQVVDRALHPDPAQRYPEGAAFAAALRLRQESPRRRALLFAGVLTALLALVALGAWAQSLGDPSPPATATRPPATPSPPAPPRYPAAWEPFLQTELARLTGEWTLPHPAQALAPDDAGGVNVADRSGLRFVDAPPHAPPAPHDQVELTLPQDSGEEPFSGAAFGAGVQLSFGRRLRASLLSDSATLSLGVSKNPFRAAAFTPKGEQLYGLVDLRLVRARTRSVGSPRTLATFPTPPHALAVAAEQILVADGERASLLDLSGIAQARLSAGGPIADLAFWGSPPRPLVLSRSGALYFFSPKGAPSGDPLTTALGADSSLVVRGGRAFLRDSQRVLFVELADRSLSETLDLSALNDPLTTLGVSPEGSTLALGTQSGRLLRFALEGSSPSAQSQSQPPRLAWGDLRGRHASGVTGLCLSAGLFVSVGRDDWVHVWDPLSGERRRSMRDGPGLLRLYPAGPGRALTLGWRAARLWDLERGRELLRLPLPFFAYDVSLSREGHQIAVLGQERVEVWALPERSLVSRYRLPEGDRSSRVLRLGSRTLVGFSSGMLRAFSDEGKQTWQAAARGPEPKASRGGVEVLRREGEALFVGCEDGSVTEWLLPDLKEARRFKTSGAVTSIQTQGETLLVGLRRGQLEAWDRQGTKAWERSAPGGAQTLALPVGTDAALVAGTTGVLHLLETSGPKGAERWERAPGHVGSVSAISFSKDGARVLGVDSRGARAWATKNARAREFVSADVILRAAAGHGRAVVANLNAPPGSRGNLRCSLEVLGLAPGRIRRGRPMTAAGLDPSELAISGDGSVIAATGRRDPREVLLLSAKGELRTTISLESEAADQLKLSLDGRLIGISTASGFQLWDTGRPSRVLELPHAPAEFVFLPTQAPRLALCPALGPVTLVDPILRKVLDSFEPHAAVEALAGTPAGQVIVLLADGAIELWEAGEKRPRARFDLGDPYDRGASLAVDSEGRRLAVGTGRGRIALFDLPE